MRRHAAIRLLHAYVSALHVFGIDSPGVETGWNDTVRFQPARVCPERFPLFRHCPIFLRAM